MVEIIEIKPFLVTSKFPARLEDHSLSPNNCFEAQSASQQSHNMKRLYCTVMRLKKQPSLTFSFSLFSSLQTEVHDS